MKLFLPMVEKKITTSRTWSCIDLWFCIWRWKSNWYYSVIFLRFNDCPLEFKMGKLYKKNPKNTKGISRDFIEIDNFSGKWILSKYHLSSFIKRDKKFYNYGTISAVKSYLYFFTQLKDWMIDKFNTKKIVDLFRRIKSIYEKC